MAILPPQGQISPPGIIKIPGVIITIMLNPALDSNSYLTMLNPVILNAILYLKFNVECLEKIYIDILILVGLDYGLA